MPTGEKMPLPSATQLSHLVKPEIRKAVESECVENMSKHLVHFASTGPRFTTSHETTKTHGDYGPTQHLTCKTTPSSLEELQNLSQGVADRDDRSRLNISKLRSSTFAV